MKEIDGGVASAEGAGAALLRDGAEVSTEADGSSAEAGDGAPDGADEDTDELDGRKEI